MNAGRARLLLLGLFLAPTASADIAPIPIALPEGPPPWIEETKVAIMVTGGTGQLYYAGLPVIYPAEDALLRLADVSIQFSQAVNADLTETRKTCGQIEERPGRGWVVADASCEFEIVRAGAETNPGGFWIGFPIRRLEDPVSYLSRFVVETDGVQEPSTKPMANYTVTTPGESGAVSVTYEGRYWFAVLKDALSIRVTYRVLLPVDDGKAFFRYVLRSGGKWSAPLGKETVTVAAAGPLMVQPTEADTLLPVAQANGSLRWTLLDVRPTEDIELFVSSDGARGQIASSAGGAGMAADDKALRPLPIGTKLYWGLGVFLCASLGFILYLALKRPSWAGS